MTELEKQLNSISMDMFFTQRQIELCNHPKFGIEFKEKLLSIDYFDYSSFINLTVQYSLRDKMGKWMSENIKNYGK